MFLKSSSGAWWCHNLSCALQFNKKLKTIWLFFVNNVEDFSLYYFKSVLPLINPALIPPDHNLSISYFTYLLRTTEITWPIFSLLILKEYKAITHSQTTFGFFNICSSCSSPLFSQIEILLDCPNFWTSFSEKWTCYVLQYPLFWSILLSFLLTVIDLCLKDFSHSNLRIWFISFSVAFLTKPYNYSLSSSIFLLSFFQLAISPFCDLVFLSSKVFHSYW